MKFLNDRLSNSQQQPGQQQQGQGPISLARQQGAYNLQSCQQGALYDQRARVTFVEVTRTNGVKDLYQLRK